MLSVDSGWLFKAKDENWYIASLAEWPQVEGTWEVWQVRFEWWAHEDTCYSE